VSLPDGPQDPGDALSATARQVRQDIVRMVYYAGEGHLGGSLSVADLVTALVFHELRIDPEHPDWSERDRLVLSKGNAAPALYAALARRGFFDPKVLLTVREVGSPLQGHLDRRTLPAVEASTGAAGQGIGMAVGMALDARLSHRPSRVFVIAGDGECRAGATWEGLMAGGSYALDNLVVILDWNQPSAEPKSSGPPAIEPILDKLRAFGYEVLEVDGHSMTAILGALAQARSVKGHPAAIVARTIDGKGVSFMENEPTWRTKAPSRAEAERALAELGGSL
jgi:transketolase